MFASVVAVAAVTPGPSRCERVVPGQFHYYTPVTHKLCCSHNSVTASDLTEWFQVQRASVLGVEGDVATVGIELAFRDISHSGVVSWKPLRWYQLGEMHGRRVHASVVSTGLDAAWHVHPVDEDVSADETLLRFQLKLPQRSHSALSVRMLLNFGVRADVRRCSWRSSTRRMCSALWEKHCGESGLRKTEASTTGSYGTLVETV